MMMSRIKFVFLITWILYSCNTNRDKINTCNENFAKAKNLAYKNPDDTLMLDSALSFLNQSMECDAIKKKVVDLKIAVFVTLKKYDEGILFLDSLTEADFIYSYKLKAYRNIILARRYELAGDSSKRNQTFQKIDFEIQQYIETRKLETPELNEAFTDLFSVKSLYLDPLTINKDVDLWQLKYPIKKEFLNFFRKQ